MNIACLLALLVASVSWGNAAVTKEVFRVPSQLSEVFVECLLKCISEAGYDESVIQSIKQGKYTQDIRTLEALVCANVKSGFGYANGRINVEKTMREMFGDKPETRAVFLACDIDRHTTPADTFKSFLLCFREKVPFKVML